MATLRRIYARLSRCFSQESHVFDNTILALVVSTLLSILQLKSDSPFNTHPKAIVVASGSVLAYGVSCDVEKRYHRTNIVCVNIARHGRIVFGSLLMVSLTSILLPSFLQPIVFLACIMVYAYLWITWLQEEVEDEVHGIEMV
ncbi:hypothetical protein Hanom_Chr08g00727121 [Helianthus anomalus]